MLNPSMIIHQLGLLCVLDLDDRAALGEDGGRDSNWTDVRAPLGRLPVTMVDELVAKGWPRLQLGTVGGRACSRQ